MEGGAIGAMGEWTKPGAEKQQGKASWGKRKGKGDIDYLQWVLSDKARILTSLVSGACLHLGHAFLTAPRAASSRRR